MDSEALEKELHEIGIAITGMEIAIWAAMRAILEVSPEAEHVLRSAYPALLSGLSGGDTAEVKARVETHMKRWLPEQ